MHIHLPLETRTQEMPLRTQIAIIQLQLVVTILQYPNLVPLLDIPLNLFLLPLKTRMSHHNHPTCLLGGQDLRLTIVMLLQ